MRIFTLQPIEGTGNSIISACIAMAPGRLSFKTLTPKKRMQILSIALAIVKADNTLENLLYEIRQIIYSL